MSFAEEMGHDIPDYGMAESNNYFRNQSTELVNIDINSVEAETPKAYLLEIRGDKYWVPKSQVTLIELSLELPLWLFENLTPIKRT